MCLNLSLFYCLVLSTVFDIPSLVLLDLPFLVHLFTISVGISVDFRSQLLIALGWYFESTAERAAQGRRQGERTRLNLCQYFSSQLVLQTISCS